MTLVKLCQVTLSVVIIAILVKLHVVRLNTPAPVLR